MNSGCIWDLVAHDSRLSARDCEIETLRIAKQIKRHITMTQRNRFEHRLAPQSFVLANQHVSAHGAETSFVWIEFDAEPLLTRGIVHTDADIRMSVVACSGDQPAFAVADCPVPAPQVLGGPG